MHKHLFFILSSIITAIVVLAGNVTLANVTVNTTLKEVNAWWNTSLAYNLIEAARPPGGSFTSSLASNYSLVEAAKPSGSAGLANASLSWAGQVCANISNTVTCYELNGSYKPPVETVTETQTTTTTAYTTITKTITGPGGVTTVTYTVPLGPTTITVTPTSKSRGWLLLAGAGAFLLLIALGLLKR